MSAAAKAGVLQLILNRAQLLVYSSMKKKPLETAHYFVDGNDLYPCLLNMEKH